MLYEVITPTTDPVEAVKGLLAPIGGYKGYGIALAIDIMSGVMTGSNYGSHFPGFPDINMDVITSYSIHYTKLYEYSAAP